MNEIKSEYAIVAQEVQKRYLGAAEGVGLNSFNLLVRPGSVCGLLGPNGAGKTTAIKILSTLLKMDAGRAHVAGYDLTTSARQVRERIGLVGQYAAIDEILTGEQNLVLFGQLYHLSAKQARQRAHELLAQFDLRDAANVRAAKYSGGMRRRLDLAASLIVSPQVLFVDEPTTGLDPVGRREVWASIRTLVASGTTVLLTTQYLEEADQLADRISILKEGHVIAEGTPTELKAAVGGDWIDILLVVDADPAETLRAVQPMASGEIQVDHDTNRISIPVKERTRGLVGVATALAEARIEPLDISLRRPTLDEVFIHLTGAEQPRQNEKEIAA
jgi:ABC-2 type transport system ATP-binding protein